MSTYLQTLKSSLFVSGALGEPGAVTSSVFLSTTQSAVGFIGTSSWSIYAETASYVATASYITSSGVDGPHGLNSILTSSYSITSSYALTASYLDGTASYTQTASYVNPLTQSVNILGNLHVVGEITASLLYVQVITSSVSYITGSTIFGSDIDNNTHQFTGSVDITGSLTVNGIQIPTSQSLQSVTTVGGESSSSINLTGPVTASNLTATGSLYGTASWAESSSLAITASYITSSGVDGPYGLNSILTSSYAVSASYAETASLSITASYITSSGVEGPWGMNSILSASWAETASYAETASLAITASYITSSGVDGPFGLNSILTSSYAVSASYAETASLAITASYITSSGVDGPYGLNSILTSSYAVSASYAETASLAITASYITSSGVEGPWGMNSILSASWAETASYVDITGSGIFVNYFGSQIQLTSSAESQSLQDVVTINGIASGSVILQSEEIGVKQATASFENGAINIQLNNSNGTQGILTGNTGGNGDWSLSSFDTANSAYLTTTTSTLSAGTYDLSTLANTQLNQTPIQTQISTDDGSGNNSSVTVKFDTIQHLAPKHEFTGSVEAPHITGSLFGTASWAQSSSVAVTASYITASGVDGPHGMNSVLSSSYSISSSYTVTASYITASGVDGPHGMSSVLSSSHAITASYVNITGSRVLVNYNGSQIQLTGSIPNLQEVTTAGNHTSSSLSISSSIYTTGDVVVTGSIKVLGDITASNVLFQTITSSIAFVTGSTLFGSDKTLNTHVFTGSIFMDGLIYASGSPGLIGTSSWAVSASWAPSVPSTLQATTTAGNQTSESIYITGSLTNGLGVLALGLNSHAEGNNTTAVEAYSHTEGQQTTAVGEYSHAEGFSNESIGNYSHAEGSNTIAIGVTSHTEGNFTTAVGDSSHAEGNYTTAIAPYSHTEGDNTIAISNYQHVQGQYNLPVSGTGGFIIGNGNFATRSNLMFASGNLVQVTGSVDISGSYLINGVPIGSGTTVTIASNAPTGSIKTGSLWFDSDTTQLYIYYEDTASSQWVGISTAATTAALPTSSASQSVTPVGTIIQSMLTEAQLTTSYGSGWILADGRNVAGSTYTAITGFTNVPDLRGVYLRGKNNGVTGTQANPDGDLALGTYQDDAFESHTHQYTTNSSQRLAGGASFGDYMTGPTTATSVATGGNETRPKSITINHFIKIN